MHLKIRHSYLLIGIFTFALFAGCQRDDICPESTDTTPMLVINFFDENSSSLEPRPSVNLTIREVGRETIDTLYYRENRQSIRIPLRTDRDSTKYEFVQNGVIFDENGDPDPELNEENDTNTDIITFNYSREEEYINRACSFKVNFLNMSYLTDGGDDGRWISRMRLLVEDVVTDNFNNVENDPDANTAHLNLYFE
ncbi:DUF6452 family protein [Zunongwangia endophytica]|uniref:DUF6452 family protein n=1 Tax=Zunongwangia endophytica TaxID=1808945 RepID=A0ABV8H4P9_9FLAO|nr:DUF6452 family protein [Zunongwangia endophytica]MDN3594616.1 DUF6452 family protein [Zunongwangia endophytica]